MFEEANLLRFTYLGINLFTLSYPLFKSFEDKIAFYRNWRFLFPAILFTSLFFLVWDAVFTQLGVWAFSPMYTMGLTILGMPIEEWLFFPTTFYACVFIYEVMTYLLKWELSIRLTKLLTVALAISFLCVGVYYLDRLYTSVNFIGAAVVLFLHIFFIGYRYMSRFYIAYAVCLLPFLICNGILTALPVVSYDPAENLGIRIFTIPVEDTVYCLYMLLMTISIYEGLKERAFK